MRAVGSRDCLLTRTKFDASNVFWRFTSSWVEHDTGFFLSFFLFFSSQDADMSYAEFEKVATAADAVAAGRGGLSGETAGDKLYLTISSGAPLVGVAVVLLFFFLSDVSQAPTAFD